MSSALITLHACAVVAAAAAATQSPDEQPDVREGLPGPRAAANLSDLPEPQNTGVHETRASLREKG